MQDAPVHKSGARKARTKAFGVRVPVLLLHDFEAARLRHRPDLDTRQDAVVEAMRQWIDAASESERAA